MSFRYEILTTVLFRHSYFTDNTYRGFTVVPDAATVHQLKRLSILFKPTVNGFSLLYEIDPNSIRTRADVLKEPLVLGFMLNNNDADFVSYTAGLPTDIENAILYLCNRIDPDANVDSDTGVLHDNPFFSVNDILQNGRNDDDSDNKRAFFSKPFGWMEIRLHAALEKNLVANFQGKETVWRYIISSDHLQELSEPAVIHRDTKESFNGPVWIVLPDGKKRMAFESKRRIPLCSKPEKVYQLVENFQPGSAKYKVVMSVLPNPNIKLISLIQSSDKEQANNFSEIII